MFYCCFLDGRFCYYHVILDCVLYKCVCIIHQGREGAPVSVVHDDIQLDSLVNSADHARGCKF